MAGAKIDIEIFDGTGDFRLWRVKMSALLIRHGCEAAVKREVTWETTATRVWTKFETLYMKNSLANKLYLKKKLYTLYMPVGRKIPEHIDEFNKIVLDLANIEVLEKQELFGKNGQDLWDPFEVESLGVQRVEAHLCNESGIARHLIVVGTLQQNGLTGQMDRILMDKIKEGIRGVQKPKYEARLVGRGFTQGPLEYEKDCGNNVDVTCFLDSDYAKDPDRDRPITKAGYMAFTETMKEAIWLRGLLKELGVKLNTATVYCDHQSAIHLLQNHVFQKRTKHINVHYHFIIEVLEVKTVEVLKVGIEHNDADALTKVVHGLKFQHCLELLSVSIS
ncbi:hypothetical protein Tco_0821325 [Tanacetum coccineum]|uniref:Uncharacterized protein n=1 Tax=Tanacetum coccineum TaxID=301880 RepID=A0ABQ5ABX8_9ASTR